MKPVKGNQVHIFFRNGMQAEGIVESWSDGVSVLGTSDPTRKLIINKTSDDIMMIKIVATPMPKEQLPSVPETIRPHPEPLSKEAQEARKPLPPEMLVGALQDRVHKTSGKLLSATPLKLSSKTKEKLEEEFQETYEMPSNDDLRIKRLAQLRIMMADQDRKIIENKLNEHTIVSEGTKVQYGNPFTK